MQFQEFNSQLIYSSLGSISIDYCFFNNINCSSSENDYDSAIKLEKNVTSIFKKSIFRYIYNFAKVRNIKSKKIKIYHR